MNIDAQHALRTAHDESRANAEWQLSRLRQRNVPIPPWLAQVASALGLDSGATKGAESRHGQPSEPTDQSRVTGTATRAALANYPVPGVTVVPNSK